VLAGLAGAWTNRQLKLDKSVLKQLSGLNKELFIPLLIFSSCADGITYAMLIQLPVVPLLAFGFMLNGLLFGQLAARSTGSGRAARPVTTAICGFSNVVGLPLPLLMSIVAGYPALGGPGSEAAETMARCLSYLFLINVVTSVSMWSCAPRMLASAAAIHSAGCRPADGRITLKTDAPLHTELGDESDSGAAGTLGLGLGSHRRVDQHGTGTGTDPANGASDAEDIPLGASDDTPSGVAAPDSLASRSVSAVSTAVRGVGRMLAPLLAKPAMASFIGITVGANGTLRSALVVPSAPLRPLIDACAMMGRGAIPLIIFTLGATLADGPSTAAGGLFGRKTLVAVLFAKLLLVPAANLGLLHVAIAMGLLPVEENPLLPMALLVVGCSPTAMNLSTISQLAGVGEHEVAQALFWQYLLAGATMTIWGTVGLFLFCGSPLVPS
jgi:predicted permease